MMELTTFMGLFLISMVVSFVMCFYASESFEGKTTPVIFFTWLVLTIGLFIITSLFGIGVHMILL